MIARYRRVDYPEHGMERYGGGDWCKHADVKRMVAEHREMAERLAELEEVHVSPRGKLVWSSSGEPVAPKAKARK